jgi:hypothetical protein
MQSVMTKKDACCVITTASADDCRQFQRMHLLHHVLQATPSTATLRPSQRQELDEHRAGKQAAQSIFLRIPMTHVTERLELAVEGSRVVRTH